MSNASIEVTELPKLPARRTDAHKGDFGRVLVVAGSVGMPGAGAITALAALRSGAGLVTLLVPARAYDVAAGFSPCVMTRPAGADSDYFSAKSIEEATQLARECDVMAIGPGLGRRQETCDFVAKLLESTPKTPVILDADGLFAMRDHLDVLAQRKGATILTPHPGEMSMLTGASVAEIQADRVGSAGALASRTGAVVVLKGHHTVIADGERHYINRTGNPGLATAGSGDVLTGVIAALYAQGLDVFDAACLGVCLHGVAGDLASEKLGEVSMIATDVIDHLSDAFLS